MHAKHFRGFTLYTSLGSLILKEDGLVALDIQTQQLILQRAIAIPRPRHVNINHADPTGTLDIEMHAEMRGSELVDLFAIGQRPRARPFIRGRLPVRFDLARRAQKRAALGTRLDA